MESLLPTVPNSLFTQLPTRLTTAQPRRRVGMLSGCVQQVFFQHVNAATLRVLAAEGCEIVIPEIQECCGALMVHSGYEEQAQCAAIRMISAFENENVDAIIINAAGCGSTMKQYGHLLRDDPDWAERAAIFSAKCRDIAEFLCELPPRAPRNPLPLRAAYHDACHLQHAQGIHAQPRTLLAGIPALEIAEMPDAAICCGSAGVYNLLHPRDGRRAGRPQGGEPARHAGRGGDLRQSRLPAAADERSAPPRAGCHARIPHGGTAGRVDPRAYDGRTAAARQKQPHSGKLTEALLRIDL